MTPDQPQVLVAWHEFVLWFFPVAEKLPRSVRQSLTIRLQDLALDIQEGLVEARFQRERLGKLREVNLRIERLRAVLRVAHGLGHFPERSYVHASERIDEAGRMVGGWMRSSSGEAQEGKSCGAKVASSAR